MPSRFAAQTMPLGQLFATLHIIQTPPYQRPFSWEQKEAGPLLEDVVAALDAEGENGGPGEHFLGTMLFIEGERSISRLASLPFSRQPPRVLDVVDGLQRLTTLTILFCIIRDLDESSSGKANERLLAAIGSGQGANARHRLRLRQPDEAFFQTYVRVPGATRINPASEQLSLAEERIIDVRNHLAETVRDLDPAQRQRLADFLLDKCLVVMVATAGIDRAHRIFTVLNARGKPLARNDILKADLLGSVPPAAMEHATAIWDRAQALLGDGFESLFSHIRSIHGRSSPQVISAIHNIAAEAGGGQAFVETILQPATVIFDDISHARHAGSAHSRAISASLTYLGWLKGNSDWVPPALLWWLQKGHDPNELAWFLVQLDRLAYGLRILGHGTKRRIIRFGAVVHAIRNGQDPRIAASPLNLTRDELRTIHHNLRDLHARSAPIAKLVLLRLNDHIAGSPQNLDPKEMTVEHILPRKPGANSQWRGWFADPAERDNFTESLGNLVLTTKPQNDKAGNLDFERKRQVLFNTPGAPIVTVNDYVRRQSEWKAAQIIEREAELLRYLDRLWKVGEPPARSKLQTATRAQPKRRRA